MCVIKKLPALFFVLCVFSLNAQVRNYTFTDSVGSYTFITGGTQHGSATVDDASFDNISLGFNFVFNEQTFSNISINSNGYIVFGSSAYETYNPISDPSSSPNAVSAITYDIKGQSNGELRSRMYGSSPNRVFIVQWKNFKRYSFNNDSLDFQIRLYETSNHIEIAYGRCELGSYTNGVDNLFEVGLRGNSNNDFSNRSISNSNNWNNSYTGNSNSASCRITSSIKPQSGLIYKWENIVYQNDVSISKIISTSGCGASSNEEISVVVKNVGIASQSSIPLAYQVNGGNIIYDTLNVSLLKDSSSVFAFSTKANLSNYGLYTIKAWSMLHNDSFTENDTFFGYTVFVKPVISQYPYNEGFESNDGYWHGSAITGSNPWEWGSPAQTKISSAHGGQKVWMTDLNSNYPDNSQSSLQSPCFDFTGFGNPKLSFYMRMETEPKWDPMVLEASTDQGKTWMRVDSNNTSFYNSTASGGPFDPPYFSGSNTSWTKYTADLSDFGNYSSVTFRYKFLGDGSTNDEGIAIDDVEIYAQRDMSMIGLYLPQDSICGDSMTDVWVVVKNTGKSANYNFPVEVQISGANTATISKYINYSGVGETDTIKVGSFNASAGGTFQFICYSKLSTDQRKGNDTIVASVYIKPGIPIDGSIAPHIPFQASQKQGNINDPDIVCIDDTITYKYKLPSNYLISGLGSSWFVTNLQIKTANGYPPSDTAILYPSISDPNLGLQIIPHSADADSLYLISFMITNSYGCNLQYFRYFKIGEQMSSGFTASDNCFGENTSIINNSTVSSGNLSYHWEYGNNDTSNKTNPTYQYPASGVYNISLIATSDLGCKDTFTNAIEIFERPVASFSFQNTCANDSAIFTNTTKAISDTVYYFWNYGNGQIESVINGKSVYDSGYFNVWLKAVSKNGCADSVQNQLEVYPLPNADFVVNDICFGDTLFLENKSVEYWKNKLSYSWLFNGSDTSTLKNPFLKPKSSGYFDMHLTVLSDKNCQDTISKKAKVHENPVAGFNFSSSKLCLGDTLFLTNSSSIGSIDLLSYAWKLGKGDTSSLVNPFIKPDSSGNFYVNLIVTSEYQCTDSLQKSIPVYPKPTAAFSISDTGICLNDTLFFTNNSSISDNDTLNYHWNFGSLDTSSQKEPFYVPDNSGSITISLLVFTNKGCYSHQSKKPEVYPLPDASFTPELKAEGKVEFILSDTNQHRYFWEFGDGDTSNEKLPNHQYRVDGDYQIKLAVWSQYGCFNQDSVLFNISGADVRENIFSNDFKVYPNPFSNEINLEINNLNSSELQIQLYDMNGKLVKNQQFDDILKGANTYRIPTEKLSKGFYLLRVFDTEGLVFQVMVNKM